MIERKATKTMALFLAGILLLVSIGATTALADPEYDADFTSGGGSLDEGWDNNTHTADDSQAELDGYLTMNSMATFHTQWNMHYVDQGTVYRNDGIPGENDPSAYVYTEDNITEGFVELDMALRFNVTVVDYDGIEDVESVKINFWYNEDPNPAVNDQDFNTYEDSDNYYGNTASRYGNYRFVLEYDRTEGPQGIDELNNSARWKLHDATNNSLNGGEVSLRPDLSTAHNVSHLYSNETFNTTMYDPDVTPAVNLSFYFVLGRQIVHAPADGGVFQNPDTSFTGTNNDYTRAYFNDNEVWRKSVVFRDTQTELQEYPLGEFGTYRYSSLYLNDTTPYASGDPGETIESTPFLMDYSANAGHKLYVNLTGNLTRNDWAKNLQWVDTGQISVSSDTLTELYETGGVRPATGWTNQYPAENYGNTTGANANGEVIDTNHGDTYAVHHSVNEPEPGVMMMQYDKGPERWGNQSVGTIFTIQIPANTLGGSYHTGIKFRVSHN